MTTSIGLRGIGSGWKFVDPSLITLKQGGADINNHSATNLVARVTRVGDPTQVQVIVELIGTVWAGSDGQAATNIVLETKGIALAEFPDGWTTDTGNGWPTTSTLGPTAEIQFWKPQSGGHLLETVTGDPVTDKINNGEGWDLDIRVSFFMSPPGGGGG